MPLNRLFTTFVPLLPFLFFAFVLKINHKLLFALYAFLFCAEIYFYALRFKNDSEPNLCLLRVYFYALSPTQYLVFYFRYTTISCLASLKEPVPCGPFSSHVPSAGCGVKCLAIPHIYLHTNQKSFN